MPDHSRLVADWAATNGKLSKIEQLCATAGLLHDLGKYSPLFQRRISGADIAVDHSTAGAAEAIRRFAGADRVFGELIAYAIAGHHAGLPDRRGATGSSLAERLARFEAGSIDPSWQAEFELPAALPRPSLTWAKTAPDLAFQLALLGRMLFSALVDADFKATEAFYDGLDGRKAYRDWPGLGHRIDDLRARLDRRLGELAGRAGPVMSERARILAHVRERRRPSPACSPSRCRPVAARR